jgi:hypothetical protein
MGPKGILFYYFHLRMEPDPVFEKSCFLVIQTSGRWTKLRKPVILNIGSIFRDLFMLKRSVNNRITRFTIHKQLSKGRSISNIEISSILHQ